jgi:hypothetical protein
MPVAVGPAELEMLLLALCLVVLPIAAIAFARSGKGLAELGRGRFAVDREEPRAAGAPPEPAEPAVREEEVRQMVEAAAYRRRTRGEEELDVEAEIDRILGRGGTEPEADGGMDTPGEGADDGIRNEIRQLVIANNERRERRGEEPLDVESEVSRRLREWT